LLISVGLYNFIYSNVLIPVEVKQELQQILALNLENSLLTYAFRVMWHVDTI